MSSASSIRFQIWKTVKIGTGIRDADGFCLAIDDAKMCISKWSRNEFVESRFDVATEEQELDLALISLADLGFDEPVRHLRKIYERATGFGLGLCPLEVGPQFRLQYKDQPEGEHLWIAMEPIGTNRDLFTVGCHNSMLYFSCSNGHDRPIGGGTQWYPDSFFVFIYPRNSEGGVK